MLQRYNKIEWQLYADIFLMRAFWDAKYLETASAYGLKSPVRTS